MRHLLVVGAYRDNEVNSSHPLLSTLDTVHKAGASVQQIVLAPLGLDDVGRLVADSLNCERIPLTSGATGAREDWGNPFFAIQFFTALTEEGLRV